MLSNFISSSFDAQFKYPVYVYVMETLFQILRRFLCDRMKQIMLYLHVHKCLCSFQ